MDQLYPLATESDYVFKQGRYYLDGKYLALPGSSTDNPKKGAVKYNESLLKMYSETPANDDGVRWSLFLKRHSGNHRLMKINWLLRRSVPFDGLSKIEAFLLFNFATYQK
jgi:hypothetical protein